MSEIYESITMHAITITVLGFLGRSIIVHWLNKDISTFQARLELDAKQTISNYQSELEKDRIRLQISYGGIFEKQAQVILEIYKLVVALEKTISLAAHASGDKDKEYEDFRESWRNLATYFEDHRILLPELIEGQLEKFHVGVFSGVRSYRRIEEQINRRNITNKQLDRLFERQDKALADLDEIPKLKKELTKSLRKLIGIVESNL